MNGQGGGRLEPLASRKLVCREACSEGSETAKLGTEEHELNKRLSDWMSKHIIAKSKTAMRTVEAVDSAAIEGKKMPLPGEVSMRIYFWNGEVSRSHSR